jgi:hypothetical protein
MFSVPTFYHKKKENRREKWAVFPGFLGSTSLLPGSKAIIGYRQIGSHGLSFRSQTML